MERWLVERKNCVFDNCFALNKLITDHCTNKDFVTPREFVDEGKHRQLLPADCN